LNITSAIDPPDVKGRAVARKHAVASVLAVQGLERTERNADRIMRRARREAEQGLVACPADVRDRERRNRVIEPLGFPT